MAEHRRICPDDNWTKGFRSEEEGGPRAIRWATRMLERMFSPDWTKWHYTEGDGSQTACRVPVQLFTLDGSPQEREVNYVNCKRCLHAMAEHQKDPS